ncbi:hypothetical protein [Roseivirga misakiensis]|uniref:Macroglobulin domain-containing protein n=1 Tax=Roseivirga misakiensis TaxID=1563681 RepID=A0A1E5T2X0_9BACT|nr:hypothetical protein [Roseivirga misakiensis]OEK05691.1 hypothetical protein BFP71_06090 [Roseivirga misakiensis]
MMISRFILLTAFFFIGHVSFTQVVEKSHLSTDKDIYAPQDTIWFKGYSFNILNQLSEASLALHVLMVDGEGNKKTNTSWELTDGITDGYLVAPKLEGKYRIIAVTGQMIGSPMEQTFTKDIFVRSEIADEIEVLAFPQFETYIADGENAIDIFTRYSTNNEAPEVKLSYTILSNGQSIKKGRLKTSTEGKVTLNIEKLKKDIGTEFSLLIESDDKRLTKPIKLTVPVAVQSKNIDLQFFPEGGELIAGMVNKVAYKAIDQNGEAFDLKGVILDDKGKMVAASESFYQGMGSFDLLPDTNSSYFFKVTGPVKIDSLYKLPRVEKSGIQLSIKQLSDSSKRYAFVKPTADLHGQKGKFVIAKSDKIISSIEFTFSEQEYWQIASENLGVGVYNLRVTDANDKPIAERLLFANSDSQLDINVQTDKKAYSARELVEAKITVKDKYGLPVQGNFSFAAIDAIRTQSPSPDQPNLLAQILLTSDLRGSIPTPNFYFTSDRKAEAALDLVMLTNGWRRYVPSTIIDSEGLAGSLHKTNRKRKLLTDREVVLTSLKSGGIDYFKVDSSGLFKIPSSYLRAKGDSFLIFSERRNEKDKFSLIPNQDKRIAKDKALFGYTQGVLKAGLQQDLRLYEKAFKLRPDRFQNTLLLNSVVVEGKSLLPDGTCKLEDYHNQWPWYTKTREELNLGDYGIVDLVTQVNPYETVGGFGDAIFSRTKLYGTWPMRVYINCVPIPRIEYRMIRVSSGPAREITQVNTDNADRNGKAVEEQEPWGSTLGPMNSSDYFVREREYNFAKTVNRIDLRNIESISINTTTQILTRMDHEQNVFPILNINTINDQLIYKPIFDMKYFHSTYQHYTIEFYSPVYATEKQKNDPVPDLRTTIFWQANVITDENGQALISYYNADRPNEIKLIVEGVDGYSRLGFGTLKYQVEGGPVTEGGQ